MPVVTPRGGSVPPAAHARLLRLGSAGVLLAIGSWHAGHAAWIEVKAQLAQLLIRRAWRQESAGAGDTRPWPWADTHPVARLLVPSRGVDTFVLAGASGRTLAFGPGHLDGTSSPGARGNAVISGHRDTHFAFLRRLERGDLVVVEARDGRLRRFVVASTRIVDRRDLAVVADVGDTRLTLVTCYPFDALQPGGPLRYVVVALAVDAEHFRATSAMS
ncbi:MAG: class GN sortase [Burkholderiales bacterium]